MANRIINLSPDQKDVRLDIRGDNNLVIIGKDCRFSNATILAASSHNRIIFSGNNIWSGRLTCEYGQGWNTFIASRGATCNGAYILLGNSRRIIIGADCMIGWGVNIRTTDSHHIFSLETGEELTGGGEGCDFR